MIRNLYLLICFVLLFLNQSTAQQFFPRFRYLTSDDGLFANMIHFITQDQRGYMWFAAYNGISRYDSNKFINYLDIDSHNGTPTHISTISTINGDLWIGSAGFLYKFDYIKSSFERLDVHMQSLGFISSIVTDSSGNIWIGSEDKGLWSYHIKSKKLTHYAEIKEVQKVLCYGGNEVHVISRKGNIYIFKRQHSSFEEIYKINTPTPTITSASLDRHGNIWLGDKTAGVFCYRQSDNKHIHYPLKNNGVPIERIHSIIEYDQKQIMIGSDDGITILDKSTGSHFTVGDNSKANQSLALNNRFVYPLYKDKDDGVWIGTYFGGVNYLGSNKNNFYTLSKQKASEINMGQVISRFCEDAKGNIWIGTDDGGLYHFNPKSHHCQRIYIGGQNEPLNIHALYCTENTLWVGTYQRGLYKYDVKSGTTQHYAQPESIYSIAEDRMGRLWIGTPQGLYFLKDGQNQFIAASAPNELIYVDNLKTDEQDRIWMVSDNRGLSALDIHTLQITHYDQDLKEYTKSLVDVQTIHHLDDKLWLGIDQKGLAFMDLKTMKISSIKLHSPAFANASFQYITSSDKNKLWITTSSGLFRYKIDKNTLDLFNKDDGLETERFNPNAGLRTADGTIYIGGYQGFNYFHPKKIVENAVFPKVRFTDFQLLNTAKGEKSPLLNEHIVLRNTQTMFSIDFSSMYYASPSKIRYKYMLEGFDKQFIEVDQGRAHYTNVAPGDYVFKVVATSSYGQWDENYTTMRITVLPPWWNTLSMRILYIVILLTLASFFIINRQKKIKKRNDEQLHKLQQEHDQKIIESKMEFFTAIAHEIRTPATLISTPIEVIMNTSDLPSVIREDMEIIYKNSNRLIQLINQVLDFRNIEYGYNLINYTQEDIGKFISEQLDQYKKYCENHKIALNLYLPEKDDHLIGFIDQDIVAKIFNNLLSNAVKYTKDTIDVFLDEYDSGFTLSVHDNGKGIARKNLHRVFEPFYTTSTQKRSTSKGFGIGLSLVSKLIEKIGGEIHLDSQENLYTRFTVIIPFGTSSTDSVENTALNLEIASLAENPTTPFEEQENAVVYPDSIKNETILLVEDDEDLALYLEKQIGKRYQILRAENGRKALEILSNHPVNLIVSDVSMNEIDGFELCKKIKEDINLCHIPIILLTAQTDVNSQIKGVESGADVYLTKPVSLSFLYAQINGMLQKRKQLIELLTSNPKTVLQSIVGHDEDKKFISRMEEIIIDNLSNTNFSVNELAQQMYVSRSSLYTKVSAISDLTPNEFINLIRLRKAAQYLSKGEYKINEICYLVGYNSPSYFTRCFVKQFGISPKEYKAT